MAVNVDDTYGKTGMCPTKESLEHFPMHARGSAIVFSPEGSDETAKKKDASGTTNPKLHRRVDSKQPPLKEGQPTVDNTDVFPREAREVLPRDYNFTVQGNNSYRTVRNYIQNENTDDSEIP